MLTENNLRQRQSLRGWWSSYHGTGVMEFVESLQLFKCEGASEIQLIVWLPILQRAQRGCLLKSTFPGPSTVVPEAMEIKSWDCEALDQPWAQSGTVQILAKGSQGCLRASSMEGHKHIPGQSDHPRILSLLLLSFKSTFPYSSPPEHWQ